MLINVAIVNKVVNETKEIGNTVFMAQKWYVKNYKTVHHVLQL